MTHPTTLRPVQIVRLLEQQGSPLAPLAEEIFDLEMAYRIDAGFALASGWWKASLDACRWRRSTATRRWCAWH